MTMVGIERPYPCCRPAPVIRFCKQARDWLERGDAIITRDLAEKLGLGVGDAFEISTNRKKQRELLRIPLTIANVISRETVVGQWVMVAPSVIQEVEAFIDGFALPDRGQGR